MKELVLSAAIVLTTFPLYAQSKTSPDGQWVVFVKHVSGPLIGWGAGEEQPAELWQVDARGKNPTLLVRTRKAEKMEDVIAGFDNLWFSSDGKLVYLNTPAWATSPAVRVVDTTNRRERFVIDGVLKTVERTQHGDALLVGRRKYDSEGGYYQDFLVSPEGRSCGQLVKRNDKCDSATTPSHRIYWPFSELKTISAIPPLAGP
jgi:hypothetical protein